MQLCVIIQRIKNQRNNAGREIWGQVPLKERSFQRMWSIRGVHFIPSHSGKIKVLTRKQNSSPLFFDVATFNFMVKTSSLSSEGGLWRTGNGAGGAERPSESIRHPDAGRLPLTLSWKRAQPAEARMLQTGPGGKAAHSGSD